MKQKEHVILNLNGLKLIDAIEVLKIYSKQLPKNTILDITDDVVLTYCKNCNKRKKDE